MLRSKSCIRLAGVAGLVIAGVLIADSADGRGFGGGGGAGGFRGGGNRGGFGLGSGYYRSTGYTPGQVANTYAAMGYRPGQFSQPGYGFGYGSSYMPYYGGYGYYPYWGGYSYGQNYNYNYNYNPSEYLQGAADVYNAQGNFLVKQAEAQKISAEAKAAQLDNQRKAFDQALYEREHTPTAAEVRAKELENSYRRSMADPPLSLVVSGQALNDLLAGLASKMGSQAQTSAPEVPLEEDLLKHINVTSGEQRTSAAMLNRSGKIEWPTLLQGDEQKKLDTLIPQATDQVVKTGMAPPALLGQINDEIDKLVDRLDNQVSGDEITPNQHIQGKRFINNLKTSLRALKQPNAKDYFNGTIAPKGETVTQLVRHMSQNNLRFTPALPGEEDTYVDLHRRMVAQACQACDAAAPDPSSGFRVRVGPTLEAKPEAGAKQ